MSVYLLQTTKMYAFSFKICSTTELIKSAFFADRETLLTSLYCCLRRSWHRMSKAFNPILSCRKMQQPKGTEDQIKTLGQSQLLSAFDF